MYKACIFDLDGTLTDTLESLTFSVNESLREMRLPKITEEQCRTFVGNGARVLMEKALAAAGADPKAQIEEAMEVYGRIFDANCTYHVIPYKGICKMLDTLKTESVNLAVLSNKPHKQAVYVVEKIFGTEYFQLVQGQKDGVPRKPDPTALLEIADRLHVKPDEVLYIGDSEVDIATGKAADMKTIGVTWGFRSREALKEAGAEWIIDAPEEIAEMACKE